MKMAYIKYNKPIHKKKTILASSKKESIFSVVENLHLPDNDVFLTEGPYYHRHKRRGYDTSKNLFDIVELEITTDCNLKCINCDRSCRQAPSKERMTLESIQAFVDESLQNKHEWKKIVIIGGEPTLHPKLNKIFDIFRIYKDIYHKCNIKLYTNGYGNEVKKILKDIPKWIRIRNSRKKTQKARHLAFNKAPIDYKIPAKACSIPWRCGLGLTKNGYYPCGAGASIDRVFQFGIGIKNIKDLTFENIIKQLNILCLYCGYNPLINNEIHIAEEFQSTSWKKEYQRFITPK